MIRIVITYLVFFFGLTLVNTAVSQTTQLLTEDGWKLEQTSGNIEVFTRKVEGKNIKDLKITCKVRSSLNSIVAILDDIESHPVWVYRCTESKFIDYRSPKEFYYYIGVDFPYPARDRDMVIYYKRDQDPITKVVTTHSTSAHDLIDENGGIVRITDFESIYRLVPNKDGSVEMIYYLRSDPAGHIPAWMINMALAKGPVTTMKTLSTEVMKDKYQNAVMEGIQEVN